MRKNLVVWGVISWFSISSWAGDLKPKYGPEATPLSVSHEFFLKNNAPAFWELIPYYIPQRDGASCSLAAATMLVNAARAGIRMTSEEKLATQDLLLKKANDPGWDKALHRTGVDLDQMGGFLEKSLKAYGIQAATVEVMHVASPNDLIRKRLHQALVEMEKTGHTLLLANFDQGIFTDDAHVGHWAPLGAYDAQKKRVLVLDPDREWYEPYWVSEETLLRGMATSDSTAGKNRGFVTVKLPERQ